jgi:hypothetical protein
MSRTKQLSTIFSLLIVVIVGGLLWHLHTVNRAENKKFNSIAEPMIKDLASSGWSPKAIYKYASPRLKKWMDANPELAFGVARAETGNMKEYEGVQRVFVDRPRDVVLVTAIVQFDYDTIHICGKSYITLVLYNDGDKWSLDAFAIDDPTYHYPYMYGNLDNIVIGTPMEEFFSLLRWFTGNQTLRLGCLSAS